MVDVVTNRKGVTNGGDVIRLALEYCNNNEKEVWDRFKKDMPGYDQSGWFYNVGTSELPKDMGYYVGYSICRHYYDNAKDKKLTIKEILETTYQKEFLLKSRYDDKFKQ